MEPLKNPYVRRLKPQTTHALISQLYDNKFVRYGIFRDIRIGIRIRDKKLFLNKKNVDENVGKLAPPFQFFPNDGQQGGINI